MKLTQPLMPSAADLDKSYHDLIDIIVSGQIATSV